MNEILLVLVLSCKQADNCEVAWVDSVETKGEIIVDDRSFEILPIKGAGSDIVEGIAIFENEE